jgi:hypothetical protein
MKNYFEREFSGSCFSSFCSQKNIGVRMGTEIDAMMVNCGTREFASPSFTRKFSSQFTVQQ